MNGSAADAHGGALGAAKRIFFGAFGGSVGVMLVALAVEMARSEPGAAFSLVREWGPNFVVLVAVLAMGGQWMKQQQNFQERQVAVQQEVASSQRELVGQMQTMVTSLSNGVQTQAVSMRDMSEALDRVANKDNELLLRLEARMDETSDRTRRILEWIELEEARRRKNAANG